MREIKFRAWCDKEMKYDWGVIDSKILGSIPIMQSTGLKAKDVEIYEGDVVKMNNWDYLVKFGECAEILENSVGFYCIRKAKVVETAAPFIHGISFLREGEVVGNIYENPDLISNKRA